MLGAAAALAVVPATLPLRRAWAAPAHYDPTWTSVDQHPPAPEWFQDAKFGIYAHWGPYSTPAYDSEWYPRNMYIAGSAANRHHIATYGDPSAWPYHNFILGARDLAGDFVQFAPRLRSAGGEFDPDEWAQIFADAGARIVGQVAEHCDGFSMWDSQVNEWNSARLGPRLNFLRLFGAAYRAKGLRFMATLHHGYHISPYFDHVPPQPDPSLRKLYAQLGSDAEAQLWLDKIKEVVDQGQPDAIYHDVGLTNVDESRRLQAAAYYYNAADAWGRDVVLTYKDGYNDLGELFDYERGGPAGLRAPYWQTDDSIASNTWCFTVGISLYSAAAMLHSLIDRISKGGNVMLNVCPTADGTIPQDQRAILGTIGDHFRRAGESLYTTRAWDVFGEGPTQMGGGSFTEPRAGTPDDIRYTRNKAGDVLYATVLGWPGAGRVTLATLGSDRLSVSTLSRVELLGATPGTAIELPDRTQDRAGLRIALPAQPYPGLAYVLRLTFSGPIPTPSGSGGGIDPNAFYRLQNAATGLALDGGGSVASGSAVKQWTWDGSTNLQWRFVPVATGYSQVINRTNGLALDGNGATANGSRVLEVTPDTGNNHQHWQLQQVSGATYRLINRTTGMVLDGGAETSNGALAKQWVWDASPNLQWTLTGS